MTVIYALVHLLLIVRPIHPCDEIHFPVFTLLLELTKYDFLEKDKDADHEFDNFDVACSSHLLNINIQIWGGTYTHLRNHFKVFELAVVKNVYTKILMVRQW